MTKEKLHKNKAALGLVLRGSGEEKFKTTKIELNTNPL